MTYKKTFVSNEYFLSKPKGAIVSQIMIQVLSFIFSTFWQSKLNKTFMTGNTHKNIKT